MRRVEFVSPLARRLTDYLAYRRLGGMSSTHLAQMLRYFDRFIDRHGFQGVRLTRALVEAYLASMQHLGPGSRTNRMCAVRQFCRYLQLFDPQCFVPEPAMGRFARPVRRPHIYSGDEIRAIVHAANELSPAGSLRGPTYATLFGLLWSTGLRCAEAFALNLEHVDLDAQQLFIEKGKFGKARWVPIASSTGEALRRYRDIRSQAVPATADGPFFVMTTGRRLYHTNVHANFRQALTRCGLRGGKGCPGPRLHDLRHTFACTRVLAWYHEGNDVNALLPALATYLGHVNVRATQVYLHATAELLEQANRRFAAHFRQHVHAGDAT
jgi:integrase